MFILILVCVAHYSATATATAHFLPRDQLIKHTSGTYIYISYIQHAFADNLQ